MLAKFNTLCCGLSLTFALSAIADPGYNYTNGHYFEIVPASGITWDAANQAAPARTFRGVSGHLATITSAAELAGLRIATANADLSGLWLGGVQTVNAAEPAGGWTWATGEPWQYTNWLGGEPNDSRSYFQGLNEDRLATWSSDGRWNDAAAALNTSVIRGYLVEYDVPFHAVTNPANLHSYIRVDVDTGISWNDAAEAAQNMGSGGRFGHLATITSADEQAFIVNTLGARHGLWLGGMQTPGSGEPLGEWGWLTSEMWNYTNWSSGEPNDERSFFDGSDEDRLVFWSSTGQWNDLSASCNRPADANGYIVEFYICAADFNADGAVDFFDYLDYVALFAANDPLADFNMDGIVDFFDYLDFVNAFSAGC